MLQYRQTVSLVRNIDAQENDAEGRLLQAKNQFSKILVAGQDDTPFRGGYLEDTSIRRSRRKARCTKNIVVRVFQKFDNQVSDVRIDEKFHVRLRGD
jgi:hypothetical protein